MPQLQTVDLSPIPRNERTPLEQTLEGFSNRNRENQIERREGDTLRDIYGKYKEDGRNLEDAIIAIQTRPGLSPTTRVNSINQLLNFQKYNQELQKKAQADAEKAEKKAQNEKIVKDIETRRGLEPGTLAAYAQEPKMAEQITRPAKEPKATESSKPIDEDQLKRIQHVRNQPGFMEASSPKKYQMLTDAGVSRANAEAEAKIFAEDDKTARERESVINKKQAEQDVAKYNELTESIPRLFRVQETIKAASKINEEDGTGQAWDQAMQVAGLLQYTSENYREFASYAKEMVKNQNIRNIVGSQISAMEFQFFRDATISERFSKEANRQILKKEEAAVRYEKLYAEIAKNIVDQNGGKIPERFQDKINEQFSKQSEKITEELKDAAANYDAIQNVPKGYVLMYDSKRRPLHVKENEVARATKAGASLR